MSHGRGRFYLLPRGMWWEQSPRPGCDHSWFGKGPVFSSPLQYQSSVPESQRALKHRYHMQEQAGSISTFSMVKNLQGLYSPSHILQNRPQGSSSGQDWDTLRVAMVPRALLGRNTRAALSWGHHSSHSLSAWEDGRPGRQPLCWQNCGNQSLNKSIHHPTASGWIPASSKLISHKTCCESQQNTKFNWKRWIIENQLLHSPAASPVAACPASGLPQSSRKR